MVIMNRGWRAALHWEDETWLVLGCVLDCFGLIHQPFTYILPWMWSLCLFLQCPQVSLPFGLYYYKYLNPGGKEIALKWLHVLEKASHLPGYDVLCSPCVVSQWPSKKTRIQPLLDHIQNITSFIKSRESAFFRATGLKLAELPGNTELHHLQSVMLHNQIWIFSLLIRKIRKICIDTNSHAYVHTVPSSFPKSVIHFLYFYLPCLIGKCLAVTMRILG